MAIGPSHPSPNWDARPSGATVEAVVLHYTGMPTAAAALARLRDPLAKVSAHYLVLEDGEVLSLVAEEHRAWHAGRSAWLGRLGLNDFSVGIELVNPGHSWGYRPFSPAQMGSLASLLRGVVARWHLGPTAILGHSDVAPDRKQDPGELFDWRALARCGLCLWPELVVPRHPSWEEGAHLLRAIGYPAAPDGLGCRRALASFQRRFRPRRVDGNLDHETMGLLAAVARLHAGRRGPI